MTAITSYEDLIVWQKGHARVLAVYALTKRFPSEEKFALTSQVRRAAVSVPANIAEGFRMASLKHRKSYYNVSQGSVEDVRYYLRLACDLGFVQHNDVKDVLGLLTEVSKMLRAMVK